MVRSLLVLSVLALANTMTTASAQDVDRCNDVLVKDLANRQVLATSQDSSLAIQQARCATSAGNSSGSSSTSAGGSYGVISGNFKTGNSNSQSNQASDCGSGSTDEHASAALYYSQTAFHDVVDAWQRCMSNARTFSCSIAKNGGARHLVVVAKWDIQSGLPTVRSSNIQIGDRPSQEAYPKGTQLLAGENQLYLDRNDDEAVTVSLNLTGDNYSGHQCSVMVPSINSEKAAAATAAAAAAAKLADLDAQWTDQPAVAFVGQPGCSCISTSKNFNSPASIPHPAYPAGATVSLVNSCSTSVSVWAVRDTVQGSVNTFPGAPAQGRSFSFAHLAAGQKLRLDLSGAVGSIAQVRDCPAASVESSMPPGQQNLPPPPITQIR